MIDINLIRERPEEIKKGIAGKKGDSKIVDRILKVDETRRQLIAEIDKWRQARNLLTRDDIEKGKNIKEMLKKLEPDLSAVEGELKNLLYQLPNPPAPDVPLGKDESENVELRRWGKVPEFDFPFKAHYELGEMLDIIDVRRAAKVSGSRFGYLKGDAVMLELALVRFAFDLLIKEGFTPVIPPVMISLDSMKGMGYIDQGTDDSYVLEKDNLILVATSEQSIGPMHKDEVLNEKELPHRYAGFSTCFRREAGSYGKDTKGTLRVHQFNKVEMFSFIKPEDSDKEHDYLLSLEEKLMQAINLPYRVMKMCTGDLGGPAARKYDIEAWLPSENAFRETHSTSNCTDFQARRLNIKYRNQEGKLEFVHMLNGTAFSERPILAILENFQQKDGTVLIPEVLHSYTGFKKISPK